MATPMIADVIAYDSQDQPVLIVEVKGRAVGSEITSQLLSYLEAQHPAIPYGMVVDPDQISLLHYDCKNPKGFSLVLKTQSILQHYEPDFEHKRIFEAYLSGLVEAWLRDLALHWKFEKPPGSDELDAIGLLSKLADGTTRSEVSLVG
jgi:hypothetical protein